MRVKLLTLALALSLGSVGFADSGKAKSSLEVLALSATSNDPTESAAAIDQLRSRGLEGLDALLSAYAGDVQSRRASISGGEPGDRWQHIAAALDRVAAQRDAYAAGLYWYTDFDQARAAAKASAKPILSLRLLGKLDEDLSCANSRFFRIALYSNSEISKLLREHFILHWESVRTVPKVTIDFGDGRKLERTLTGNSIHYVLDADGRPICALPGLYGPTAFLREIERAEQLAGSLRGAASDRDREAFLRLYHQRRLQELAANWEADLKAAGVTAPLQRNLIQNVAQDKPPTAEGAAPRAVSKMVVERPILRGISPKRSALETSSEDLEWAKIARLYAQDARLDNQSLTLMRNKNPGAYGGADSSGAFQRARINLERAIAEDTARNKYTFETTLHLWFVAGLMTKDLHALNEKVYAELFLTPSTDPWLGLFPVDSYTGIENEGVRR
ncbi:MAG TPA: hypothetical protein VGV87_07360 [Blastocatellia bacterium]|jgi:hypothetical protein|nr:hypothetical protein [Blastocatellia bacterium]